MANLPAPPPPGYSERHAAIVAAKVTASTTSSASTPTLALPPPRAPPQPSGWRPGPNNRGKNPRPPQFRTALAAAPPLAPPTAPPPPPASSTAPPPPPGWRPSLDPWTGLVQAWPMPWSAPMPYGTPPAYTGGVQPGARPHTGAPILAPRQPTAAYHVAPFYAPPIYNTSPYASYGAPSPPYMQQYNDGVSLFTLMPALPPMPPHPQAPMTTLASTSTPSWDEAVFLQAMNNFDAQGNSDLGLLHHFLGIAVIRDSSGVFLSQRQYTLDLLSRAGSKISVDGDPSSDPSLYRSLTGALQQVTVSRSSAEAEYRVVAHAVAETGIRFNTAAPSILRWEQLV
nr:neural Wiskott-Aldrich syndrome protein-like [Aegilops tauschii subsp. strangulata]